MSARLTSAVFLPSAASEFPNDNPALHGGAVWLCLEIGGRLRPVVRAPRPIVKASPRRREIRKASPRVWEVVQRPWAEDVADTIFEWLSLASEAAAPAPDVEPIAAPAFEVEGVLVEALPVVPEAEPEDAPGLVEALLAASVPVVEAQEIVFETSEPSPEQPTADPLELEVVDSPTVSAVADLVEVSAAASDDFDSFVRALVEVALASGFTRAAAVIPALVREGRFSSALLDEEASAGLVARNIMKPVGSMLVTSEDFAVTARAWSDVLRGATDDLSGCGTTTLDTWGADLLMALRVTKPGGDVRRELRRRGVAAFGMLAAAA